MSGDTDKQLDATSRELLRALDDVKEAEAQKRREERSSPRFHELADEVERKARGVWDAAAREQDAGSEDSPLDADLESAGPGDWTRPDKE